MADPIKVDGVSKFNGTFDKTSLKRFSIYKEVCASCHSINITSYRNLGEPGGPEFSEQEVMHLVSK